MSTPTDEDDTRSGSTLARSSPALQWRNEKPTEEGIYCYRERPADPTQAVRVYRSGPFLQVQFVNNYREPTRVSHISDKAQWAGPIPEPREPEANSAG